MAGRDSRRVISISGIAGPEWEGYELRSFGMARSLRLFTPSGVGLQAAELNGIREAREDLGYLQVKIRELEGKLEGSTASFSRDESHLLRVALEVLLRELPVQLGRRDNKVRSSMLLRGVAA